MQLPCCSTLACPSGLVVVHQRYDNSESAVRYECPSSPGHSGADSTSSDGCRMSAEGSVSFLKSYQLRKRYSQ